MQITEIQSAESKKAVSDLVLRVLALMGIVWDLHPVPGKILEEGRGITLVESMDVANPG